MSNEYIQSAGVSAIRFGDFELDMASGDLRRGGALIRLQPQPLKILLLLASRAGQVVSRHHLQRQVWPGDTFVDFEHGLNYCIARIRAVLGDSGHAPRFIQTVPKRGYRFLPDPQAAAEPRLMLVVLPFQNLTGDARLEFIGDGVTEEVTAELGRLNPDRLGVIARTSALRYKHTAKCIETIGRELAVSYAVEGSVRHAYGRVRVTAHLIRVADQTQLWTEIFDGMSDDILALQARVAEAVTGAASAQLTPRVSSAA